MAVGTAAAIAGGLAAAGSAYGAYQNKKGADEAMDAQRDQNARNEQFLREQYAKGRRDVLKYVPQGADAARKAYEEAYELSRRSGKHRVNVYNKGNQAAQNTLLAGLPQMQAALMGDAVDLSALQPTNVGGANFYDSLKLDPNAIPNALAGASDDLGGQGPAADGYNFQPGVTNRELVEQAYQNGDITDYQYGQFMEHFNNDPNAAGSQYWGAAGASKPLLDSIATNNPGIHPKWQATLSDLFTSIYD